MPLGSQINYSQFNSRRCYSEWMSQDTIYCREVFMTTFKQPVALRDTFLHVGKGDYITLCLSALELIA